MRFPTVLWKLIKTYARDMELLEQTPDPQINLSRDLEFPVSVQKFFTDQFYELMVSNLQNVDLESYISDFLSFPLDVYYRYTEARIIWQERCGLWGINAKIRDCSIFELVQLCFLDTNPLRLHRTMLSLICTPPHPPPMV